MLFLSFRSRIFVGPFAGKFKKSKRCYLAKCCGSFNKFSTYFRPSLDPSLSYRFFTERRNEKSEERGRERWGEGGWKGKRGEEGG